MVTTELGIEWWLATETECTTELVTGSEYIVSAIGGLIIWCCWYCVVVLTAGIKRGCTTVLLSCNWVKLWCETDDGNEWIAMPVRAAVSMGLCKAW